MKIMNRFHLGLSAMLIVMMLSSCSKNLTPFTQDLYDDFDWTENELSQIQFYLSNDIVLWRDKGTDETTISKGTIKIKDGREVEEINFKKGTPGVFVFSPKQNRFGISFEEDDSRYLMFGPNKKARNRYVLLAKDWSKRTGKITYDNKVWRTSTESAFATLLVDLEKARTTKYRKKTVGGRTVN